MSKDNTVDKKATASTESAGNVAKPPRKKFKHTRELMRIAIGDGMTQEDIAKACRVSQPVVSKWVRGESQGTEQSLAPLLKRYGSRLSRGTSRVYLAMDDADPRWENTKIGQKLLSALDPKPSLGEGSQQRTYKLRTKVVEEVIGALELRHLHDWEDALEVVQVRFAGSYPNKTVEVDGPVIFRYTFNRLDGRQQREGIEAVRSPVQRWFVHDGQRSKLILVRQYRRHLDTDQSHLWSRQRARHEVVVLSAQDHGSGATSRFLPRVQANWLECADDAGRWVSRIERPMTVEELLAFVDGYVSDAWQIHTIHDQLTLPFLVRKALLERRHSVPGVERIADYE